MDCEKWSLGSGQIHAYVQTYKDVPKVHLRHFKLVAPERGFPTQKGVTLNWDEWESLKSLISTIDLEFRKQLSKQIETVYSQRPWCHGVGEIPANSSHEVVCSSFEGVD